MITTGKIGLTYVKFNVIFPIMHRKIPEYAMYTFKWYLSERIPTTGAKIAETKSIVLSRRPLEAFDISYFVWKNCLLLKNNNCFQKNNRIRSIYR